MHMHDGPEIGHYMGDNPYELLDDPLCHWGKCLPLGPGERSGATVNPIFNMEQLP